MNEVDRYLDQACRSVSGPVTLRRHLRKELKEHLEEAIKVYQEVGYKYMLMPDHVHLIISIAPNSDTTLGAWVKAFKAVVANRAFKWQSGFFDHVLRSDESRAEKWEYIRMNPVRAGLVRHPDDWPFAQRFNPFDGSEM